MSVMLAVCPFSVNAENSTEETEQGLEEIQPLIEMTDVKDTEGMSLEEMTDAFADAAMCEYMDSVTGFRMQYPATFQFSEGTNGLTAATADGKATMNEEQDKMIQTDLYYLTEKSFHHIILRYPSAEEETYSSYIDYMINTMETNDSELG